jgi:hypothetical protein
MSLVMGYSVGHETLCESRLVERFTLRTLKRTLDIDPRNFVDLLWGIFTKKSRIV